MSTHCHITRVLVVYFCSLYGGAAAAAAPAVDSQSATKLGEKCAAIANTQSAANLRARVAALHRVQEAISFR